MFRPLSAAARQCGINLVALFVLGLACGAPACTTFYVHHGGATLFGRNYDWDLEEAQVMVNPRGLAKRAFSFGRGAEWTSRYRSVTFNQYGREFPCDGMNEAGLVVAVMWLERTQYPPHDDRPLVSAPQWVQYQLDTAATVEEVLASDSKMRLTGFGAISLHYLVADARGNCAAIEFLDGRRVVHSAAKLPIPVLTNQPYELLLAKPALESDLVCWRFALASRAVAAMQQGHTPATPQTMFRTLHQLRQEDYTKWSIVYDLANKRIDFRTRSAPAVKTLRFAQLDPDPAGQALQAPIAIAQAGPMEGELEPYSRAANREQVDRAFRETDFLGAFPQAVRDSVASYPESLRKVVDSVRGVSETDTDDAIASPAVGTKPRSRESVR